MLIDTVKAVTTITLIYVYTLELHRIINRKEKKKHTRTTKRIFINEKRNKII